MLNPSWLQPPDFWQREFGMETRSTRRYDRWASLQRITPEDVIGFYDRYYVPEAMTLTVIGDLDRAEVLAISERTLGSLIKRPVPPPATVLEDPARRLASTYWGFGPNVQYTARYKLFDRSAQDDLMLLFVRDLLGRRLNQRLRYGQQKAVYGVQVTTTQRGPAGFLEIDGSIAESEYDFALGIIQEEIAALVGGTLPPEEFEADRTALTERLRVENSTAQALNFWVLRNFYDPSKHADFPDVLSFFQDVTQGQVAAFATRTFVPEREVSTLVAVQPTSQLMLAAAVLLLVFGTIRAIAWALTRPVTMPGILYMARFRVPPLLKVGMVLAFGLVGLILARLIVFGAQSLSLAYVVTADEYSIQMVYYSAMLVTAVTLFILYLSRFPHKILVFPDHIRIKFLAYRSRIIKPDELLELSTRRIQQVWFKKDLFRCIPMAMGLVSPGIYLRPTKGKAYFFRSRDTQELIDVLGGWRGVSVTPAVLKKKPSAVARDPFQEATETSDWIASIAPEGLPEGDDPTASSSADPLPGLDEPAGEPADSMDSDPLPGLDGPIASIASDPLPGLEDASASFASDPLPGLEDSSASIASDPLPGLDGPSTSMAPDPIPQKDVAVSIASLAPDDSGDGADSDKGGMGENEIKELLGDSYKTEVEKKF